MRPLGFFLFLLRPAIVSLNGLGNLVLRLVGLQPGASEGTLHSPEELKLLVQASQDAGILHETQEEVVVRVLNIGERPIGDIMTPRPEVDWIDLSADQPQILRTIRECRHEQLLVARDSIDEPLGMVVKSDLLHRMLDGQPPDPLAVVREPLVVHEAMPIFRVLELFKKAPVRLAVVVDEYGSLEGIVTQTDLLEAMAGDLPDVEGEEPSIIAHEDGSFLIDGMTPAHEVVSRLGLRSLPENDNFHTVAGFALSQLRHLPTAGETFTYEDWRFEVVDIDGRQIDKLLAHRSAGSASPS